MQTKTNAGQRVRLLGEIKYACGVRMDTARRRTWKYKDKFLMQWWMYSPRFINSESIGETRNAGLGGHVRHSSHLPQIDGKTANVDDVATCLAKVRQSKLTRHEVTDQVDVEKMPKVLNQMRWLRSRIKGWLGGNLGLRGLGKRRRRRRRRRRRSRRRSRRRRRKRRRTRNRKRKK